MRSDIASSPSASGPQPRAWVMDRPVEKKLWNRRRIAFALAILIAAVVFIAFARRLATSSLNVERNRLTISTVDRAPFQEFTPVTGNVVPRKVFYLETVEGGRVEEIFVEEGQHVRHGDAILRLANSEVQLEVLRRQDQLTEQVNRLINTRLSFEQQTQDFERRLFELRHGVLKQRRLFERDSSLSKEGLIPEIDFELSRDEYQFLQEQQELEIEREKTNQSFREEQLKQLEEAVGRMRESLAVARDKLEKLTLRAPVDGRLTSLDAEIGQSKTPGDRLGQVDLLDDFKVLAKVDQIYISRVGVGQAAQFDLEDDVFELHTSKVYPEVEDGKFEIDLEFADKRPREIKRGQTLHTRLMLGELSEAVVLDVGAFFQKTGGQWAYVIDPSDKFATRRTIRLGRRNTDYFEILEGLEPGERVITSSYENLGDFDRLVLEE